MDFDVVFILGPQGSGKSTQGKRLAEKLGFLFWDMGDILREILRAGGPLAHKITEMKSGVLLPDEVILDILKERLLSLPRDRGVIFDGVPRRIGQAEFLLRFLEGQGRKKPVSLLIDIPREVSRERLLRRAGIEGRSDDTPGAIAARLAAYDESMRPVTDYLKEKTRFITIDGIPSVEEIAKSIDAALGLSAEVTAAK